MRASDRPATAADVRAVERAIVEQKDAFVQAVEDQRKEYNTLAREVRDALKALPGAIADALTGQAARIAKLEAELAAERRARTRPTGRRPDAVADAG